MPNVIKYYYTTEILATDPDTGDKYNTSYLSTQLAPGESWRSKFHEPGLYILEVEAPASRHRNLFPIQASFLGDTIEEVQNNLRTQANLASLRDKIQIEWQRLKDLGEIVPDDPVKIVH